MQLLPFDTVDKENSHQREQNATVDHQCRNMGQKETSQQYYGLEDGLLIPQRQRA